MKVCAENNRNLHLKRTIFIKVWYAPWAQIRELKIALLLIVQLLISNVTCWMVNSMFQPLWFFLIYCCCFLNLWLVSHIIFKWIQWSQWLFLGHSPWGRKICTLLLWSPSNGITCTIYSLGSMHIDVCDILLNIY